MLNPGGKAKTKLVQTCFAAAAAAGTFRAELKAQADRPSVKYMQHHKVPYRHETII